MSRLLVITYQTVTLPWQCELMKFLTIVERVYLSYYLCRHILHLVSLFVFFRQYTSSHLNRAFHIHDTAQIWNSSNQPTKSAVQSDENTSKRTLRGINTLERYSAIFSETTWMTMFAALTTKPFLKRNLLKKNEMIFFQMASTLERKQMLTPVLLNPDVPCLC